MAYVITDASEQVNLQIVANSPLPTGETTLVTAVIDVTFVSASSSSSSSSVNICFQVNETISGNSDACLAYLDESSSPPQWVCEDQCIKYHSNNDKQFACGKTPHLTSFALLLGGIANGGDCGGNGDYILGTYKKDLILVGSLAAFIVLIAILFVLLFSFTPLREFIYGKEGNRIRSIRTRLSTNEGLATSVHIA